MSKYRINVGRIKAEMAKKGMSQEAAAEKIGITQGRFRIILSQGKCAAFTLGKIARVLGLQAWELVEK